MALILHKSGKPATSSGMKILDSLKKQVSIKHMIHKSLAGWEEPRPHGKIHASELLKEGREFCPREWAFLDLGLVKQRKPEFVGTAMRITFHHGQDMERRLRNQWLRDYMVGTWECGVCSFEHPTFGKAPNGKCPKCGWGHQWQYKEVRLLSPTSGVSGGVDCFVDTGEKKHRLLEIKSMAPDMHKVLKAPLAEHKMRTSLYLRLAAEAELPESERINTSEATILYVSKSYGFKDESLKEAGIADSPFSPFKEFVIQRDDSLTEDAVNKAKALTLWRKMQAAGTSPGLPCGVCANGLIKRAQQCSAIGYCFSGSFMSTITWMENGKPKHPGKPLIA